MPVAQLEQRSARGEIATLLHESSHYLLGLVGSMALGFVSFPIFTRVFPVADYGIIDLVQKILLVITAVAKLGLQNSVLRFYDAREFAADRRSERRYYSTLFFGTLAPALVFAAVFAAVAALWSPSHGGPVLAGALLLSAALVVPRSAQAIFWSFLRVEERTKAYNVISVTMKAATILAICVLIQWKRASASLYFGATALVEAAFMIGLTVALVRRGVLAVSAFDGAFFRGVFLFGMPLVVNEVAFVVLDAGDRTLVQHYLGGELLGLYAVAYGLASMVQGLLMTPLSLAVLPMYLRLWAAGEREKTVEFLSIGLDFLLLGSVGLFVLVSVTAHDLVLLSASSKYQGADSLIPMIFAALLIFTTYVFVNAGLMIEKKTARIAGVMTASAVVNVALNCILLPAIGLRGAALATLLSYAFCILLMGKVSFQIIALRIAWNRLLGYAIAGALAWIAAGLVHIRIPIWSLMAKGAIAGCIYVAALYLIDGRVRSWASRIPALLRAVSRERGPDR